MRSRQRNNRDWQQATASPPLRRPVRWDSSSARGAFQPAVKLCRPTSYRWARLVGYADDDEGLIYRDLSRAGAKRTAILRFVMNLPAAYSGGAPTRAPRLSVLSAKAAVPAPAPASTATHFGAWQLSRLIRRGAYLDVFRAKLAANDLGPGCYAVKLPRRPDDPRAAALLRREALVAREVAYPSLISVLATERGRRNYIVLPYLEGITLARLQQHLSEGSAGRLPVATALAIARQIAGALAAMHQAGWLHGQVRPEHVIVSPQGQATLIDVTQARRLDSGECYVVDAISLAATYAAPETSLSRGRLTAAADTYALGVMLFKLLAGEPPFAAAEARQLAGMHRTAAPPELRRLRPDVSCECAELVRRMLAKEPLRRPSDEELNRWLAEIEIAELAV